MSNGVSPTRSAVLPRRPGALKSGGGDLAHAVLLQLAGHGHRELAHEADVARNLVVRDAAVAIGADLLGGGGLAGAQLDPRHHRLAVEPIGHAEHGHLSDLRVAEEELLDFGRKDLLAAALAHGLQTPRD